MAWDLTVLLTDRPGTIAEMGEALGDAGINIDGACGFPCEGKGVLHVLVDDPDAAAAALRAAGLEVGPSRPVLTYKPQDKPGELGALTRRMADAGVNVDLLYLTMSGEIVLGVDDIDAARSA
jgi:hypothetical protein